MYGRSKFHAKKVEFGGERFDSKLEMKRWLYLRSLSDSGEITALRRQVEYEVVPRQTELVCVRMKTKEKFVEKFREHPVYYKADFVYEVDGKEVIEDTKGFRTPEYIIKRKLMRLNGHPIREVAKATEPVRLTEE